MHDLDATIACIVRGQIGHRKVLAQTDLDEPILGDALGDQMTLDGARAPHRERTVVAPIPDAVGVALDREDEWAQVVERERPGELRDLLPRVGSQPVGVELELDRGKRDAS